MWSENERIYRLEAISRQKVAEFTIWKTDVSGFMFKGYVWVESDRIYRLEAISRHKVAGFTV